MGESSKKVPKCYVSSFDGKTGSPFAQVLLRMFPVGTPHESMLAFFGGRAAIHTIRKWRAGTRNPPPWAAEIVRRYHLQQVQLVDASRVSMPGAQGTQNLLRARAERLARRA